MRILLNSYYNPCDNTLHGTHIAGFYSCINQLRISLYVLASEGILPTALTLQETLHWYKEEYSAVDYYPILYKIDQVNEKSIGEKFNFNVFCPNSINYNAYEFEKLLPIETRYFSPSIDVTNNVARLISKYNISPNNTLAVFHRGTDKGSEVTLKSFEYWLSMVESKLDTDNKILIQTDDVEFKEGFVKHFGDRCFTFDEMVFDNKHVKPTDAHKTWVINYESIVRIIALCKKIIVHTGNGGLIPIIYRKHAQNVTQLCSNGVFVSY